MGAEVTTVETDYLVVGAGASGMCFTDTMLEVSDSEVVLVDCRHRPGGHWNDAYSFVRLHHPAEFYGVGSTDLVGSHTDSAEGRRGLATADEVCEYYQRVLDDVFLDSGRVGWFPKTEFVGGAGGTYELRSLITGATTTVRVRRKLVDARYVELSIPKRHAPKFPVGDGVRFLPPNDLVDLDRPASGFTVLGGGKTSMDTCYWLLEHGVDPADIRWVRSRDAWTMDRGSFRPDDNGLSFINMQASFLAAAAEADSALDFFHRLETLDVVHRPDPAVEPGFFRGATLSETERIALRRVDNVVRLGRVTRVGAAEITLEQGTVPNDPDQVVVDCTACGVAAKPLAPIFSADTVTTNLVSFGMIPLSSATIAWFEANLDGDDEKNAACPVAPFDGELGSMLDTLAIGLTGMGTRMGHPEFAQWEDSLRLNPSNGFGSIVGDDPDAQKAMGAVTANMAPAMENLARLAAAR